MKRPRRPVKRKVASKKKTSIKRERNKIITGLKQALEHARTGPLPWGPDDAAVFEIPQPPPSFAYQWSAVTAVFGMELKGWSRVPFSRHPAMGKACNFDGYIVHRDMTLFQIASELVDMRRSTERKKAQEQVSAHGEAMEALGKYAQLREAWHRPVPIMSPSFLVSRDYDVPVDPGTKVIDLSVKFLMPARWRDAAAALQIDESEYVRRRLLQEGNLLASHEDGTYSTVKLSTEKVEI